MLQLQQHHPAVGGLVLWFQNLSNMMLLAYEQTSLMSEKYFSCIFPATGLGTRHCKGRINSTHIFDHFKSEGTAHKAEHFVHLRRIFQPITKFIPLGTKAFDFTLMDSYFVLCSIIARYLLTTNYNYNL